MHVHVLALFDLPYVDGAHQPRFGVIQDVAVIHPRSRSLESHENAVDPYHSVFLQYPPREVRARIVAAIRAAGEKATNATPVAWLRLEPEAVFGPRDSTRFLLDVVTWPGGDRVCLAETDGHVRFVNSALSPTSCRG